jgi:hypothetical protein
MEEVPMATSLLYALLDVADAETLGAAHPDSSAGRYFRLSDNKKRRVRAALYEAFYAILEAQRIDYMPGAPGPPASWAIGASRGIGGALARVISRDLSALSPEEIINFATLRAVLRNVVNQAVDDELIP